MLVKFPFGGCFMKALKIVSAILLFVSIIPCIIFAGQYTIALLELRDDMLDYIQNIFIGAGDFSQQYLPVYRTHRAAGILVVAMPFLFVTGGVFGLVLRRKPYGSLIAVAFPLIAWVWLAVCTAVMSPMWDDPLISLLEYYYDNMYVRALYSTCLRRFTYSFLAPVLGLLISGIVDTIRYNRKKKLGLLPTPKMAPTPTPVVVNTAVSNSNLPAAELKQLKELLDMGAITMAEYNYKKQQLLGFSINTVVPQNVPAAPVATAPQGVGKCIACGRENVPLESVDVVVAGMSRKRTMCAECAAKYK